MKKVPHKFTGRKVLLRQVIFPALLSATLTFLVLALLLPMNSVSAYSVHGCRYAPDSIDPISYRFFSVGSDYETAFKDAEATWYKTSAPGYFKEHSTSFDPGINVVDNYRAAHWAALTTGRCTIPAGSSFGDYDGNEVELDFNTRVMNSLSVTDKKLVAMHEIGHAYGLWHVSTGCYLMRTNLNVYNSCGSTMPTADDVVGVSAIYP